MSARRAGDRLRFDGRVAVVTGAGGGLGRAHAELLAARGASVVVNDLPARVAGEPGADPAGETVARITAAGGIAVAHRDDISTEEGASALVATARENFGRLDVLVNNAGLLRTDDFTDITVELFDRVLAVNLRSTFLVTRAAWPVMVAQGFGRVVSTTSNSGLLGVAGSTAYSAAKAGVWGLTRSLALEAGPLGIHVNAIAPMAYTAMSATSRAAPEAWRSGEGDAWSQRLATALVSPAVGWLAHEACTLNGQVFSVAGGRVARFAMGLATGIADTALTIEHLRDAESELLQEVPSEFHDRATEEGRALRRRLSGPGRR